MSDIKKHEITMTFAAFKDYRLKSSYLFCDKIKQSEKVVKFSLKNFANRFK